MSDIKDKVQDLKDDDFHQAPHIDHLKSQLGLRKLFELLLGGKG